MKSRIELARRLRALAGAARPHYSPDGNPVRSILVTPDWIDDIRAAADELDAPPTDLIGCEDCPGCPQGQCQKMKEQHR